MGYFQPYVFKQKTIWIRIKDLKGRQIYKNQQNKQNNCQCYKQSGGQSSETSRDLNSLSVITFIVHVVKELGPS